MRHHLRNSLAGYVVAAGLAAVALWLELLLATAAGAEFRFLAFSIAVAGAVWHGGLGPGVLAILIACLASDYFFLGPGVWLQVDARYQAYALAGFAVGWLSICSGVHWRLERVDPRDVEGEW